MSGIWTTQVQLYGLWSTYSARLLAYGVRYRTAVHSCTLQVLSTEVRSLRGETADNDMGRSHTHDNLRVTSHRSQHRGVRALGMPHATPHAIDMHTAL